MPPTVGSRSSLYLARLTNEAAKKIEELVFDSVLIVVARSQQNRVADVVNQEVVIIVLEYRDESTLRASRLYPQALNEREAEYSSERPSTAAS
jgi:hypothetical protein